MIDENQQQDLPTSKDAHAAFCMMLAALGGAVCLKKADIDSFPESVKVNWSYDQTNGVVWLSLPKKRKRRIIRPSTPILAAPRKLIFRP